MSSIPEYKLSKRKACGYLLKFRDTVFHATTRSSANHCLTTWVFLRLLAAVYLIAFFSLWVQISGLIGSQGILPASDYLNSVQKQIGLRRFWLLPTIFWLNTSDLFLHAVCGTGVLAALALALGYVPRMALALLWGFYLSLTAIGQAFLSFQWDVLLLETGFLAIFVAPPGLRPKLSDQRPPRTMSLWLMRFLLFKLMFMSGVVKLTSGDPTWLNLTALSLHYETQPLPTLLGWLAHQLPQGLQKASVAVMFVIEMVVPFLIFASRKWRVLGCIFLMAFQVLIAATGNYCFFNLLTILLCLLLLDDRILLNLLPEKWRTIYSTHFQSASNIPAHISKINQGKMHLPIFQAVALIFLTVGAIQLFSTVFYRVKLPKPMQQAVSWIAPLRTINSYGLFRVMTTVRNEIVVEGSNDQEEWLVYEFKWKPGELKRAPGWVAPHQPRLDWQMWFAALRDYRQTSWFVNFLVRLLTGSREVVGLLEKNPFPEAPPRFVRASLYEYKFTDLKSRRATGEWWRRELKGLYCPVLSLRQRN